MSNRVTEEWLRANYPEADAVLSGKAEAPPVPVARPRRSKYGAIPTVYNGVRYASKAEATRAEALDDMQARGLIAFWVPQPKFRLGCPENLFIADFLVVSHGGKVWAEDVKGFRTQKFQRDARLWQAYGPCPLHVLSGRKCEVIEPSRA